MISKKIYNDEYAPGIATYGINGETGDQGANGNSIFYTSFDIYNNTGNSMEMFIQKIRNKMLPVHNSNIILDREYQKGDYFFDNNGNIYRLDNIDEIINPTSDNASSIWTSYLTLCGKMNTSSTDAYISKASNGRLNINNDYQGMDLIINNIGYGVDDTNYVLRIISDSPNSENKIEFICLSAINGYNISDQLNIFYDTALNAYHLKTEGPLLIDSEVKIKKSGSNVNIDGYSPVVINETPITSFYNICQDFEFQYYINGDSDYGKIKKLGFTAPIVSKNVNANIFWKKIKNMITLKIVFRATYDPINVTEADYDNALPSDQVYTHIRLLSKEFGWNDTLQPWTETINTEDIGHKALNFVTKYRDYDIEIISISLIYNTEIFTKFVRKDLSTINT